MERSSTWRTTRRASRVRLAPSAAWELVAAAGGTGRWYVDALPWVVRGGIDRLALGGGRRWPVPSHPTLRAGDRAGFWEVVEAGPASDGEGFALVLDAAVRAPGLVTLRTWVRPDGPRMSRLEQSVTLQPRGALGAAYLVADLPARQLVLELAHRRLLTDLHRAEL